MLKKLFIILLFLAFVSVSIVAFLFWSEIREFEPDVYYYVPADRSFIYSSEEVKSFGFEEYIIDKITFEREKLIRDGRSFIDVDLEKMIITLYENGSILEILDIQSKGREGSWWETPPGVYFVGDKVAKHFSSIAGAWMPYAVQFYGNFFIHGWPYDNLGRALSPGPSGGCIRLKTEDAVVLFAFSERGMPVLVFEEKEIYSLPALLSKETVMYFTDSEAVIVADLDTGEIVIGKNISSQVYAGPLVGGMLSLTSSEIVNLERRITARSWMFEEISERLIVHGRSYRGYDLISLILLRSSKEAALVMSRFFTEEYFVAAMNAKARAIGMDKTVFRDVTARSDMNLTTLLDTAKMMRYIHQYRGFIYEISRLWKGVGSEGKESVFTVFKMNSSDNISRSIFIALIDTDSAEKEINDILSLLSKSFGLEKEEI